MVSPRTRRRLRRRRQRWVAIAVFAVVGALAVGWYVVRDAGSDTPRASAQPPSTTASTTPPSSAAPSTSSPTSARTAGTTLPPENVAFDYAAIRANTDLRRLGHVKIVVSARQRDPRAPEAIHRIGAKAYRYVQTYWYPQAPDRDGLDLAARPDLGFCKEGSTPVIGHREGGRENLVYLDMNERELHQRFALLFAQLKQQGWDGIFFDRGFAALTGIDTERAGIWNRVSTCTQNPVQRGATFADSYLGMAKEVRNAGLELMFNYGISPFDAKAPLRPDPRSPACDTLPNPRCPRLGDGWDNANWILTEAVSHVRDVNWADDFAANAANEHDPAHGGQVVGLITNALLEGDTSRPTVYSVWSRAKLFANPIAVGTGSDGCDSTPSGGVCNRNLSYPELASITFGRPLTAMPASSNCVTGSATQCVWVREYEHGIVVLNASPRATTVTVPVSGACGVFHDVFADRVVDGGRCVTSIRLDLPAWAGRPLTRTD